MLAFATPEAYVIFDHQRRQHQAFDALDGHALWTFTKGQGYPAWANPSYPLLFGNTLVARGFVQCDILTGKPVSAYPKARTSSRTVAAIAPPWNPAYGSAMACGTWPPASS